MSWLAVTIGIAIGLVGFSIFSAVSIEADPNSPYWLRSRLEAAGFGLLGLWFVVGSLTALHSRRRAAITFLGGTPPAAFLLSYPVAHFLFTGSDGVVYTGFPDLWPAVVLACVFFSPFLVGLVAVRDRKRATVSSIFLAAFLALLVGLWRKTYVLIPPLTAWAGLLWAFAVFWWRTHKLAWPELLQLAHRSRAKRLIFAFSEGLGIAILCLTAPFSLAIFRSSLRTPDCAGPTLYTGPLNANHAVFTARLLYTGHQAKVSGKWAGNWGIGAVEESFWGVPGWTHLVLVTNGIYREGDTFFISGRRDDGLLTQFLPIVDATKCGSWGAVPQAYAQIELRLLRNPPPPGEHRLLGYARSQILPANTRATPGRPDPDGVYGFYTARTPEEGPLPGARVLVTGPQGSTIYTADQDGIYETDALVPADYTVRILDLPAYQSSQDFQVKRGDIDRQGLLQVDVHTWSDKTKLAK